MGQKPLTPELFESMLAWDVNDLEPRLTCYGYHAQVLADLLNVRRADIRAFLVGRLLSSRM